MLNTEIGKTGEVVVEGHTIGRLDGFTFAPSAAEAGSDAKTLQAAAQKALASEIDSRAEKLSGAADDQFVLTSDGTIRWTGDAVAKLVASDDVLRPRLRIIADERLTGAPRDAVQARLDLWLKTHIEKLLAPLFELQKAEDVTGIARGIAFQLIEALGVIERAKIANEMKDLPQDARASLRKYGVRFGAYHVYVPSLLKPAARALASLLWAYKRDNVDLSALSGAQQLASSGRTSFPADKALDRDAYRTLGYRLAGERAVRVDILERLADLIRPALAWRESSSGEKPAGAFDGRSFVVTQAMTSLTGSAGEDFAAILRALGYRMEKRPPLPPKPAAEAAASDPVAEPIVAESAEAGPVESEPPTETANVTEPAIAVETGGIADATPDLAEVVNSEASAAPALAEPAAAEPRSDIEAAPAPVAADAPAEIAAAPVEAVEATDPVVAETVLASAPAEPALVEVWRPGGRSDDRRPRPQHHRHRPRSDAKPAGEAAAGDTSQHPHGRRDKPHGRRPDSAPGEAATPRDGQGERKFDRKPQGEKFQKKFKGKFDGKDRGEGRRDGRRDGGRRDGGNRESGPSHRTFATTATPRERDRPADPNSPFAKLAALKEQLGRKDS